MNIPNILKRKRPLLSKDSTDQIKDKSAQFKKFKENNCMSESNKISNVLSDRNINNIAVTSQLESVPSSDDLNIKTEPEACTQLAENSVVTHLPPLVWYPVNVSENLHKIEKRSSLSCPLTMSSQDGVIGVSKSETSTKSSTVLSLKTESLPSVKPLTKYDPPLRSMSPSVTPSVKDVPPLSNLLKSNDSLVEKKTISKPESVILPSSVVCSVLKGSVSAVPPLNIFKSGTYLSTENSSNSRPPIHLVTFDPSVFTCISSKTKDEVNHLKFPLLDSSECNSDIHKNNGVTKSVQFKQSTSGDNHSMEKHSQSTLPLLVMTNTTVALPLENDNLVESVGSSPLSKSTVQPKPISITSHSTTSTIPIASQTLINKKSVNASFPISKGESSEKNRHTVSSILPKPQSSKVTIGNCSSLLTVSKGGSNLLNKYNVKNSKSVVQPTSCGKTLLNETTRPPYRYILPKESSVNKTGFKVSNPVLISINTNTPDSPTVIPTMNEDKQSVPPLAPLLNKTNDVGKNLTNSKPTSQSDCEKTITKDIPLTPPSPITKNISKQSISTFVSTPSHKTENELNHVPSDTHFTTSSLKSIKKETEQLVPPLAPFSTKSGSCLKSESKLPVPVPTISTSGPLTVNPELNKVLTSSSPNPSVKEADQSIPSLAASSIQSSQTEDKTSLASSTLEEVIPSVIVKTELKKSLPVLPFDSCSSENNLESVAPADLPLLKPTIKELEHAVPPLALFSSKQALTGDLKNSCQVVSTNFLSPFISKETVKPVIPLTPTINKTGPTTFIYSSPMSTMITKCSKPISPLILTTNNVIHIDNNSRTVGLKVQNTSNSLKFDCFPILQQTVTGEIKPPTISSTTTRTTSSLTVLPTCTALQQGTQRSDSQPNTRSTTNTTVPDCSTSHSTMISLEDNSFTNLQLESKVTEVNGLSSNENIGKQTYASLKFQVNYNKAMDVCKEICSDMAKLPYRDFNSIMKSLELLRKCSKKKTIIQLEKISKGS